MGVEFHLYKRSPKEKLYLGKPCLSDKYYSKWSDVLKHASTVTGFFAVWQIMNTPNYSLFKIPHVADLADKLSRGFDIGVNDANNMANKITEWAGNSDILLAPDNDDEDALIKMGWPIRGYKELV